MDAAMPDLKFLLDREGVTAEVQAKIFHAGIINIRQFAALVQDTEELRKCLKDDFGLDATNLAGKALASTVAVARETAKVRAAKVAEVEAECEVRQEPKPVRGNDYQNMKEAYEKKYWTLEKNQLPANIYIERISEGVEKADLRAETLSEMVNNLEDEVDVLRAI